MHNIYLGQMDEQDRLTGNVVFLYPTLTKAIIGDSMVPILDGNSEIGA